MEYAGKERDPGPGAYGAPKFEKYKRAYPSWKIGTSKRNGSMRNLTDAVPGPGAYMPKIDVQECNKAIDLLSCYWNTWG